MSCIDLIFTGQPDLIVDSGVFPSLHLNRHHQITYSKRNLSTEYPIPYYFSVWDYNRANIGNIKKSIGFVNWEVMFNNKSFHKEVTVSSGTLTNISSSYTSNKLVAAADRDLPLGKYFCEKQN